MIIAFVVASFFIGIDAGHIPPHGSNQTTEQK